MKLTLAEAAHKIGKSERTVRRLIKDGKIQAEKVGAIWQISDLGGLEPPAEAGETADVGGGLPALAEQLRSEVEYLRKQNEELRKELQQSRVRSDTIILQLTEQRKLLEDLREPFWRRWRRKQAQAGKVPADQPSD